LLRPLALAMTHKKGHCEPRLFVWRSSLTFRPLGGHCELVFSFAKQSQRFLAALRLGMTGQKSHCEVVVSPPKQSRPSGRSLRARLFALSLVIASLALSSGEAISDCFASLATAKNAAGLLRFARSDKVQVLLRGCLFVSEAVLCLSPKLWHAQKPWLNSR